MGTDDVEGGANVLAAVVALRRATGWPLDPDRPQTDELHARAIEDLARYDGGELEPEAWMAVYAQRLAEPPPAPAPSLKAKHQLLTCIELVEAAHTFSKLVSTGLGQFEKQTGWKMGGRQLKATPIRWKTACAIMTVIHAATANFLVRGRLLLRRVDPSSGELAPRPGTEELPEIIDAFLTVIRAVRKTKPAAKVRED